VARCGFLDLLEEGCRSAGFVTTIHWGHHLLLSKGWLWTVCSPERWR